MGSARDSSPDPNHAITSLPLPLLRRARSVPSTSSASARVRFTRGLRKGPKRKGTAYCWIDPLDAVAA